MTLENFLELPVAVALTAITAVLIWRRPQIRPRSRGLDLMLAGFVMVSLASWITVSGLDSHDPSRPELTQAVLYAKFVAGYLLGILLVGAGLLSWLPLIRRYREEAEARARAEQRLAVSRHLLARHVDTMPLAVIETDPDFIVRSWNAAAQRTFGYSTEEAVGRRIDFIVRNEDRVDIERIMQRLDAGEVVVQAEGINRRKDGGLVYCNWYNTRVLDASGAVAGYVALGQDVTPLVESEQALVDEQRLNRSIIATMPGIFYLVDEQGRLARWSEQLQRLLGLSEAQMRGLPLAQAVDPGDRARVADLLRAQENDEASPGAVLGVRSAEGEVIPHYATGAPVYMSGRRYIAGLALDISARVAAEKAVLESRDALAQRNEALQLIKRLADRLHRTVDVDALAEQTITALLQLSRPPQVAFYLVEPGDESLRLAAVHGFESGKVSPREVLPMQGSLTGIALRGGDVLSVQDIAGDPRLEPAMKARLTDQGAQSALLIPLLQAGQALGSINLVYRERRAFTAEELENFRAVGQTVAIAIANANHVHGLEHQARHDSLTDLPNRSYLHGYVGDLLEGAGVQQRLALMLLDLDRFKEVNDTLGHHVGDLLLTQIGPRVREVLGDAGGLISRLGGDEFAVVVPQPRSTHDVLKQAEAVREALRQPFEIDGMALEIGASVGVALYPDHGRDSHELMRCADIAMYFAKSTSAGVTLYTPQLDHHTPERLAMMSEIGAAIRGRQMMLNYQPLLSLNGGVCALEALTRWQHPRLGVLAPERFIGLAEMSDLIHELALWVLDSAVAEARSWHDAGHPMRVAVNLSTRNLLDLTMARQIGELITRHELPARYLEIEITESALMADPERALDVVHAIARLGVRLSIDDFGTGYSSLAYLKRLPVSTLKIDRTFVGDMLRNEQDALIVRSTVQLAQSLGLEVVAEGVEDAPTLEALRAMGCDIAQGFHIARPMAGEAVPGWLASAAESDGASNLAMN